MWQGGGVGKDGSCLCMRAIAGTQTSYNFSGLLRLSLLPPSLPLSLGPQPSMGLTPAQIPPSPPFYLSRSLSFSYIYIHDFILLFVRGDTVFGHFKLVVACCVNLIHFQMYIYIIILYMPHQRSRITQ